MKLMILEDQKSQMETVRRILLKKFPDSDIDTADHPYYLFSVAAINRPEVLILDYNFSHYKITEEKQVMRRLFKFQGLILIYSIHSTKEILEDIKGRYGMVPANFRVVSKREPVKLIKEIIDYDNKRKEGFCVAMASSIK
jgi:ABC-type molybdenum transport system ATPase subunit/photorepair protein PhrA